MNTGDKNTVPFLESGDYAYVEKMQKIYTSQNKIIDELLALQTTYGTNNLSETIDAIIADILENRIIQGAGIVCSYNSSTKNLTISLAE